MNFGTQHSSFCLKCVEEKRHLIVISATPISLLISLTSKSPKTKESPGEPGRAQVQKMPSLIFLNHGITKKEVNMCENIEFDISHVLKGQKIGKLIKRICGKKWTSHNQVRLCNSFQYYFTPFNLVRCPSSFLGH